MPLLIYLKIKLPYMRGVEVKVRMEPTEIFFSNQVTKTDYQ